jgi:NAD(P)-dependent dehydrogenase (short-subunit alcohol dehydrogenase family)
MGELDGRVALITGGASGIGLATARRLAAAGARIAVADLGTPPDGVAALAVQADVADASTWPGLVERIEAALGGLDIVHLNAGVTCNVGDIDTVDDATYSRLMRVNVDHVFYGLRASIPALLRRGGGRVVATASLAGLGSMAMDPIYSLTKHAVVGLVRSCAASLAQRGVVIAAVCPGITDTPLLGSDREIFVGAGFPLLTADDIAEAVYAVVTRGQPGECWYVQPGRASEPFTFRNVPGPRVKGAEGMRPPGM